MVCTVCASVRCDAMNTVRDDVSTYNCSVSKS